MVTSPSSLGGASRCLRSTSPGGHEVGLHIDSARRKIAYVFSWNPEPHKYRSHPQAHTNVSVKMRTVCVCVLVCIKCQNMFDIDVAKLCCGVKQLGCLQIDQKSTKNTMKHLTSPFPSSYDEEDETFGQAVKLHSFFHFQVHEPRPSYSLNGTF